MTEDARRGVVIRLLERYLTEVVERYDFCPWAKSARVNGEVGVEVLWGTPTVDDWVRASNELLSRPTTQVAMVLAPELLVGRVALHSVRNDVATAIPTAGVAEFHPSAPMDLATPSRLVPFTRRSPDPLMQLVPLATLASVRRIPQLTFEEQAKILSGGHVPVRRDPADRIAEANHERVTAMHAEINATLDDIAADRKRSYDAAGIRYCELDALT